MRTQLGTVAKEANGKYSVSFEVYRGVPGKEYVANEVTSAPVFDSEEAAYAGGNRALQVLAETDRFPNLCVPF